jgi:hypothetical protein
MWNFITQMKNKEECVSYKDGILINLKILPN